MIFWLGLALMAIGSAAALYLAGLVHGPALPVGESAGFMLLGSSVVVALLGFLLVIVGLR